MQQTFRREVTTEQMWMFQKNKRGWENGSVKKAQEVDRLMGLSGGGDGAS